MASRFKTVTVEEVTELKEAAENLNTRKSTINWVRVFEKWCDESSLEKNLEMILLEQLDKVLERFYASVCKQDGTDYEPGSLKVTQAALDRHLKEKGCSFSIIKDREFFNFRKVLEGKALKLRNEGKGKLSNKSRSLTRDSLLRSRFLGCHATLPPKKRLVTSEPHSFPFVFVVCFRSVEQTNHIIAKCE